MSRMPVSAGYLLLCGLTLLATVTSCNQQATTPKNDDKSLSESSAGETEALKQQTARKPSWSKENIGLEGPIVTMRIKILDESIIEKLRGALPREYKEGLWWSGNGPTAYQDFGSFKNYFFYYDPKSKEYFKAPPVVSMVFRPAFGAQTRDRFDRIVAEARLLEITGNENAIASDAIIEEFHYDQNGDLIFYGKTRFEREYKIKELETIGTKKNEYYMIYPALADRLAPH